MFSEKMNVITFMSFLSSENNQTSSSHYDNSTIDKSFQKDLQNKLEDTNNNQTNTFRAKEKSNVAQNTESKEKNLPSSANNESATEKTIEYFKDLEKTIFHTKNSISRKNPISAIDIKILIEKLTSLLQKLQTEKTTPSEDINLILISLNELLTKLTERSLCSKTSFSPKIFTDTEQIKLTNPRTKENIELSVLNKNKLIELITKITQDTSNHPSKEIQDIKLKIADLLDKLNGVIEKVQQNSKIVTEPISTSNPSNELQEKINPKISKIEPQNSQTQTQTDSKEQDNIITKKTNIPHEGSNQSEVFIKKTSEPKTKNEQSLFDQNNKQENKALPQKLFSLDNDISELNAKHNVQEINKAEAAPLLTKTNSNNFERQTQIINQFRTYLTINKLKTDTEVTMRLYPRELGEIKIKITKEQVAGNETNQIVAKFQVSSQAVKSILENSFDALKNSLQQNSNLLISALDVEVNNKENENNNFSDLYKREQAEKKAFKTKEVLTDNINNNYDYRLDNNEFNSLA